MIISLYNQMLHCITFIKIDLFSKIGIHWTVDAGKIKLYLCTWLCRFELLCCGSRITLIILWDASSCFLYWKSMFSKADFNMYSILKKLYSHLYGAYSKSTLQINVKFFSFYVVQNHTSDFSVFSIRIQNKACHFFCAPDFV